MQCSVVQSQLVQTAVQCSKVQCESCRARASAWSTSMWRCTPSPGTSPRSKGALRQPAGAEQSLQVRSFRCHYYSILSLQDHRAQMQGTCGLRCRQNQPPKGQGEGAMCIILKTISDSDIRRWHWLQSSLIQRRDKGGLGWTQALWHIVCRPILDCISIRWLFLDE